MTYHCMNCGRENTEETLKRRVRCIYCGYKILYKKRSITTKVKAV